MQKPFSVLCGGGVEEGKEKAGEFDFGVRRIFRRSMLKLVEYDHTMQSFFRKDGGTEDLSLLASLHTEDFSLNSLFAFKH